MRRLALIAHLLLVALATAACTGGRQWRSHLPVGASAMYGDRTGDGVAVTVALGPKATMDSLVAVLRASGYTVETPRADAERLQTGPHRLGGDSSLVVAAVVMPAGLPSPASVIVLTATLSVPSRGIRNAPVLERQGETSAVYGRLRELGAALAGTSGSTR